MNIAVILGNPYEESLCHALGAAYIKGAEDAGAKVRTIDLSKITFNPNLKYGYHQRMDLEEDLIAAQETIRWADHLVIVYPIWWGTMPAILKGFFDRLFLPGFSYKPRPNSLLYDKLLKGKSARLIVTMDSPPLYYRLALRGAGHRIMKQGILQFCGVKPVRITEFGSVKASSEQTRNKWLAKANQLGRNNA